MRARRVPGDAPPLLRAAAGPARRRRSRPRPTRSSRSSASAWRPYQFAAQHSGLVQLLHAGGAADLDRRRGARAVDQPGRGRLARRADERAGRGGGHGLAARRARVRSGELGRAHVGRRHGEHHGDDARPRRPPAAAAGPRPAAARRRAGGRARVRVGPGAFLRSRARWTSWASRPTRSASCRRTSGSGCAATRWPRPSPETAPPACARSPSRRCAARPTPARWTRPASSPTWPSARTCGCTWTRRTGALRACRRAPAPLVPDLERADSVTVDPHKWFFQAYDIGGTGRARPRGPGAHVPQGARVLPVDAARGRAAQLVPVLARGHAPVPRAEAVVLAGSTWAPRASAG